MQRCDGNWVAVFICCWLGLFSLSACHDAVPTQEQTTEIVRPAKIVVVKPHADNNIRYFPATVEPTIDAQLAFRVNGELAFLHVLPGESVQQGDVLAQLDDSDFKLQVKQAKAKYDLSLSQFNRAQSLIADKLVSSSVYDEAQAQLDISKAQLDVAKRNLEYTKITAPFAGTVAQLFIENYEFVQAKQPIMELQGRNKIDVSIEVPEQLMARLPNHANGKLYQPSLILDAVPEQPYRVTFKEYDITANSMTKTYRVVFTLDAPKDVNLLSGMTGKLAVELDKVMNKHNDSLLVPIESVFVPNQYAGQQKHFVYKLDSKSRAELVEIKVKKVVKYGAEVVALEKSKLQVGDSVVAAGSHFIEPGQKLRAWVRERGL